MAERSQLADVGKTWVTMMLMVAVMMMGSGYHTKIGLHRLSSSESKTGTDRIEIVGGIT
jgi:hypothetical protein